MYGQETIPPARTILDLGETEQVAFVIRTMDLGFPEDRADQMTMLIINRSVLVMPLLENRVVAELRSQSPSKHFIATATEMIAHAGDEQALRQISKLIAIDDKRFGSLVGRTLDNALSYQNPFIVGYRGLDMGAEALSRRIGAWAGSRLHTERMQLFWAEALLDRYGKVPADTEWLTDPLASRIEQSDSSALKQAILLLATAAQSRRRD